MDLAKSLLNKARYREEGDQARVAFLYLYLPGGERRIVTYAPEYGDEEGRLFCEELQEEIAPLLREGELLGIEVLPFSRL
jgi:hypothetical protein